MRKLLCIPSLFVGALIVMATVAHAQAANIVSVGSPDTILFPPGTDSSFSLIAIKDGNGKVTGQWADHFGNKSGIHVTVTCLEVVGNQAWVGGIITGASPDLQQYIGLPAVTRCMDRGTSQDDPSDLLSYSWIGYPLFYCTNHVPLALFPINAGQVRVR